MTSNEYARAIMMMLGFSKEVIDRCEAEDASDEVSHDELAKLAVGDRIRLTDPAYHGGTATIEALDIDNDDSSRRVRVNEAEAAQVSDEYVGRSMGPFWGHLNFARIEPSEQQSETTAQGAVETHG